MIPTSEQVDIFNGVEHTNTDLIISALAGSGKTTTMIESLGVIKAPSVLMTAFNKRIAETLEAKVNAIETKPVVHVKTFHALGRSILFHHFRHLQVERSASDDLINDAITRLPGSANVSFKIRRASVRLLRSVKEEITTRQPLIDQIVVHGHKFNLFATKDGMLTDREIDQVVDITYDAYRFGANFKQRKLVDFCDMVWGPIVCDLAPPSRYKAVIVDEMQDISSIQLALLKRVIAPGGRFIGIGDRNQAIYEWRGADPDQVWREFEGRGAKELPLTTCFRCPTKVIECARELVPSIRAREGAPEGSVTTIDYLIAIGLLRKPHGETFVLSRSNAALFSFALRAWSAGVKFRLNAGEEMLEPLFTVLTNLKTQGSMAEFNASLTTWYVSELERANKANASDWATRLEEQHAMLSAVAGYTQRPSLISKLIRDMIGANGSAILFSTVHKVKGLEASSVFLLRESFGRYRPRPPEAEPLSQEELNIEYVAITRSSDALYWVTG